jgi:hypothetical protein
MAEQGANVSKVLVVQLKTVPSSKRKISLPEAGGVSNVQAVKRKSVSL